ncbi:hypothetical protein GLOIN_2v583658 [Rhizophagus clarus]|uniref:Uncharacterized protein n=1 Tax=Rhizophagus clarus TaxID=94130 RepID=A0A8H3KZK0_9GLOM|nr:hypothetical protein GLOIN_2v583658 [Rhizophagus clarus]
MTYWRSMFNYDDPIYWQNFKDFNAKFWALRLSLFCLLGYKKIKLRELLKDAKFFRDFSEEAEIILFEDIKLCKLRYRYSATEANENKNMNKMEESFCCYTKLDCLKNEDIKNEKYMNFVFLNALGAPWDVFSFLNYESSETGIFCVTQQIKYTNVGTLETRTIDQDSFNDEYEKVSKTIKDIPVDDWFLLFLTIAESKESLNIKCKNNSTLVSRKQFQDFYRFTYASQAQFASANEKIFINSAPSETLKILGFTNHQCHDISLKQLKRPFSSLDDVKAELDLSENQFKKLNPEQSEGLYNTMQVIKESSRSSSSFLSCILRQFLMRWSLLKVNPLKQRSLSERTQDIAIKERPAANSLFLRSTLAFVKVSMIGITLTSSELEMVGPSYFSKLINTAMRREGGSCSSNRISSIVLIELLTNPACVHMFAVSMTHAPLASNNYALRPFATSELAFLASRPLVCMARILVIGWFNDLSMFKLTILTSSYFVRIYIALENRFCSASLRLCSNHLVRMI